MEELIASVETDKVTVEVRSPAAGTITAFHADVDSTVIVGADFVEIDLGVGEASATGDAIAPPTPEPAASNEVLASKAAAANVTTAGVRIHPSGRPALIRFPPRGAAAIAAMKQTPATPTAGVGDAEHFAAPKPSSGSMSYTELPARFRRRALEEDEMDAIMMGGAGYTF